MSDGASAPGLKRVLGETGRRLAQLDLVDLALRLVLLDLMLMPIEARYIRPWVLALSVVGLLVPGQLRRPWLWWATPARSASSGSPT